MTNHKQVWRNTLAGVALLTALSACGGYAEGTESSTSGAGGQPGAASGALDPCALLDEQDIGELLGAALESREETEAPPGGRACTWAFGDPLTGEGALVVTTFHGSEFFLPGVIGEPVDGIGDEAQEDSSLGIVLFRSDEEVVEVHVLSGSHRDHAADVARRIADEL